MCRTRSLDETLRLLLPVLESLAGGAGPGGAPRRRLHLLGFSQGGTVALEAARRLATSSGGPPAWLGSVVAVSASLLAEALPQLEAEAAAEDKAAADKAAAAQQQRPLPVLITRGDRDGVVPRPAVER